MRKIYLFAMLTVLATYLYGKSENNFDWNNSTIYFVITDRFYDNDSTNNVNYGRKTDYGSERMNAATFHGGDLKGILQKAKEGYFTKLGIDVIWMTDVYEQIHGWMTGSGSVNDFPHYGYHGYYPLDYTQIDKNFGTVAELRELIDTLHSQGIRVMLGANLNDPGYPTLLDAVQYGFADTGLTEQEASEHIKDWSYDNFYATRTDWNGWYGRDWIRMPDENWDETDPLQATVYGMPDYKDENTDAVRIPEFLKRKWEKEGSRNDEWVNPSAKELRKDRKWSPLQYVIAWIASWVEEFGIDGFRCDIVENVHLDRWRELNMACNEALNKWRKNNKGAPGSEWTEQFYMTGDYDGASIDYMQEYSDAGFSSMVNFYFPKHGDLDAITYVWQAYADSMQNHADWHPFSYLNNSYHREADADNMIDCATTLLLSPGAVQIFYGDESGRELSDAKYNVDSNQAFRSDMNWDSMNLDLLDHYKKLGQIRKDNPVIGNGRQILIDTHTSLRYDKDNKLLIRLKPEKDKKMSVKDIFEDGTMVIELYTGQTAKVTEGWISFPEFENNVAIIKEFKQLPKIKHK